MVAVYAFAPRAPSRARALGLPPVALLRLPVAGWVCRAWFAALPFAATFHAAQVTFRLRVGLVPDALDSRGYRCLVVAPLYMPYQHYLVLPLHTLPVAARLPVPLCTFWMLPLTWLLACWLDYPRVCVYLHQLVAAPAPRGCVAVCHGIAVAAVRGYWILVDLIDWSPGADVTCCRIALLPLPFPSCHTLPLHSLPLTYMIAFGCLYRLLCHLRCPA